MSAEHAQQLRKELKQWESAFYVVHQRKPAKNDIETAPQEIKDKYHLYFQEKKKISRDVDAAVLSPHERESPAASEVWGAEFNKTPTTKNTPETKTSQTVTPAASLDKLGAKLFQKFAGNSPPVRPKGIFKRPIDSIGSNSKSIVTNRSSAKFQVCATNEKKDTLNSNFTEFTVEDSGNVTWCEEPPTVRNGTNFDEDFVVKGELFKSAGKLFASRVGDSNLFKHQISSKPRLSFLSVNMLARSEVDDTSDDKISVQDSFEASGLKNAKFSSSVASSRAFSVNEGDELSTVSENKSQTVSLLNTDNTHLSNKTFVGSLTASELKKGKSKKSGCLTSPQHLKDKPRKNNQSCDSHDDFSAEGDFDFNESLNVISRTPEISQQVHETDRISRDSSHTKRRGQFSRNGYCGGDIVSPTWTSSLDTKCSLSSDQKDTLTNPELTAAKISSLQISRKTIKKRTRKAVSAKKETSGATNYGSAFEECADTKLTVSMDENTAAKKKTGQARKTKTLPVSGTSPGDTMDESGNVSGVMSASASVKKTCERKRKRSLDESNGWPGDSIDESGNMSANVSDEPEDFTPEGESAFSSGASSKTKKSAACKRTPASMNENYVCLNMKRKGYRRKGAGMTGPQLKRKLWKAKMAARSKSFGSNKCFKCGQEGHWANKCTGKPKDSQDWSPYEVNEAPVKESDFPSLREAALMGRGIRADADDNKNTDDITDIEATIVRESWDSTQPPRATAVLADHIADGSL